VIILGIYIYVFLLATLLSLKYLITYGEVNCAPCPPPSGPFGMAVKKFWLKVNGNYTFVYYPMRRETYDDYLRKPSLFQIPCNVFGETQK